MPASLEPGTYRVGELAAAAEVGVETIRYYQRRGLLAVPVRADAGTRRYGDAALQRLHFIKAAQRLGFSLDEVAELLRLDDGRSCGQARQSAEHKLADVRARLADLHKVEQALEDLVGRCTAARGRVRCPLIAALQRGD